MRKLKLTGLAVLATFAIYLTTTGFGATTLEPAATGPAHKALAERIISFCNHPVPFVILGLDASDKRLVGINPSTKEDMATHVLNRFFPRFQSISDRVCARGFAPNIEEILKLNPDLILHWERFQGTIDQMRDFGLHAVGVRYGSEEHDQETVRMIAEAIGRNAKADSIITWRNGVRRKIAAIADTIPPGDKPKVVFLYSYENLTVGGEKCYENFCINLVGGRNMGAGLGLDRSVNVEQILEWDPDFIIFGGWKKIPNPVDLYEDPLLSGVSAIKNRRVFKMPVWASNESVLSWIWMSEILHPERFDFDIRQEIRSVYAWQYEADLDEEDIDKALFYDVNAISPLYTHFK